MFSYFYNGILAKFPDRRRTVPSGCGATSEGGVLVKSIRHTQGKFTFPVVPSNQVDIGGVAVFTSDQTLGSSGATSTADGGLEAKRVECETLETAGFGPSLTLESDGRLRLPFKGVPAAQAELRLDAENRLTTGPSGQFMPGATTSVDGELVRFQGQQGNVLRGGSSLQLQNGKFSGVEAVLTEPGKAVAYGLGASVSGPGNVHLGTNSGSEGEGNVCIGTNSFCKGDNNVVIGHGARVEGHRNVCVGHNAGAGAKGNHCVFIGTGSSQIATTGQDHQVVIGKGKAKNANEVVLCATTVVCPNDDGKVDLGHTDEPFAAVYYSGRVHVQNSQLPQPQTVTYRVPQGGLAPSTLNLQNCTIVLRRFLSNTTSSLEINLEYANFAQFIDLLGCGFNNNNLGTRTFGSLHSFPSNTLEVVEASNNAANIRLTPLGGSSTLNRVNITLPVTVGFQVPAIWERL